jgi:hypothetical protein
MTTKALGLLITLLSKAIIGLATLQASLIMKRTTKTVRKVTK